MECYPIQSNPPDRMKPQFHGSDLEISNQPLRRVNKRGSLRATGAFASRKMKRTIPWESSNELAFLQLAELDPDVSQIYAQPLLIIWESAAGPQRHYPDAAVIRNGRLEIHEVKTDSEALKSEVIERSIWAERYCRKHGASYGLALASALKAEPMSTNARTILRRLHDRLDENIALGAVERMRRDRVVEMGALAGWLGRWNGTMETVVTLIAHNRLATDLRHPVATQSLVWSVEAFPHQPKVLPFAVASGLVP